jgi:hypothetical protein
MTPPERAFFFRRYMFVLGLQKIGRVQLLWWLARAPSHVGVDITSAMYHLPNDEFGMPNQIVFSHP